ncbi:hypothetical protein GGQ74_002418 [Desulfobaculum xiamenense]|uniref:Carboxypeptidase regulatory-like domain-containing protein n=1 Tax=Desulfobaculum xiamenense TaxID=995050 RepID=A0A846QTE7_9BACT|nr:hypothetical protein [Desulfobaculum xiamenense]NJB68745.1 hypothetical protein [Desulfobaculum xiamenense]
MKKNLLVTLCLVIAMALTGCGSSGDSDSSSSGIIAGGAGGSIFVGSTVKVFDPQKGSDAIGTGTTSAKGVFSVTDVPFGGPYIVKLTGGEEVEGDGSRNAIDNPVFAIVDEVSGKKACQITPLSQFAYWIARGHAGADAIELEDVNYAINYVKGATGVDVLNDKPIVEAGMTTDAVVAVAKTRAAIKRFEAAVGKPSDAAFIENVAMLGFDAADGTVNGNLGGNVVGALREELKFDDAKKGELEGKLDAVSASMSVGFQNVVSDLGSAAFGAIVKSALDDLAKEAPELIADDQKDDIVKKAVRTAPEIDQNPVVALVCSNRDGIMILPAQDMRGEGTYTDWLFLALKHADGSLEYLYEDDLVTTTIIGAQKDAFAFVWIEREDDSSYGLTITYPDGGFQAGEVMVTMSHKLADGREFTTSERIVIAAENRALFGLRLFNTLPYDGIEFEREENGYAYFTPFEIRIKGEFAPGTEPSSDAPYRLALTIDKGELRFKGEDEDNWASSHVVEYDGDSSKEWGFEYRIAGNWATDTTVSMTLSDTKYPDLKTVKRFKIFEDGEALRPITFGKVTRAFEVGAPATTVKVPVNVIRYNGQWASIEDVRAKLDPATIDLKTRLAEYGSEASGVDVIKEDYKFLLTFNYKAPTNDAAWEAVEDNESDTVAVTFGEATAREKKSIVLDLVMPSSED